MIKQFDLAITDLERFSYVKAISKLGLRQSEIIHHTQTQNLTWDIIYIVGVAMFSDHPIFASDICNAVKASKPSTIKAIIRLVEDKLISNAPLNPINKAFLNILPPLPHKFSQYVTI